MVTAALWQDVCHCNVSNIHISHTHKPSLSLMRMSKMCPWLRLSCGFCPMPHVKDMNIDANWGHFSRNNVTHFISVKSVMCFTRYLCINGAVLIWCGPRASGGRGIVCHTLCETHSCDLWLLCGAGEVNDGQPPRAQWTRNHCRRHITYHDIAQTFLSNVYCVAWKL